MPITIPDSSWYRSQSSEKNAPASCPYANVHKCPRYYASLDILGTAGIITCISDDKKEYLDRFWGGSGLLPVIAEEETGISGFPGSWSVFSNFCPEVAFTYFRYYASFLAKYVDDIDSACARRIAEREKKPNDWRHEWAFIFSCHFLDCTVYNQVHYFNSTNTDNTKHLLPHNNQVFFQQFFSKEITMSDQYNITGQVGAVGPNAKAENNTFNQVMQQAASNLDLPTLAAELSTLRSSMRSQATEVEHDLAVASIGAAESAAKKQDGAGALEHLKSAGKWAFDVATKIGVGVAAKAIETAINL
ncbi:hypothetical protein C4K29_0345 [Pseudomonas chlororaphis subsp. piscium]|uniref:hypothetical protein n=1 Tax=Pseudomonas chlororaphis TaxID=587753 RepID=UPI000F569521|nr:hypothetical protein [Pseudomonas chlororaphis]AZC86678.1 hypothetical protein C4K29_0345 [Pseudomonas chlororaphis subsp. piscium]